MLRSYIVIIILIIFMQPAAARMYQWVDPDSGRTQLSGTPPAWYRSGEETPRVFVFENGQLIDDTSMAVNEVQRRRLRQEALVKAEENTEAARKKAEQSALLRSGTEDEANGPPAIPELDTSERVQDASGQDDLEFEETTLGSPPELSAEQIAELRALISNWESRNQDRVREMLSSGDGADMEASSRETLQEFLERNSAQ